MIVLHNNTTGNNAVVAKIICERFGCTSVAAASNPDLSDSDLVIMIVSNAGDEELSQPMEDYLFNLRVTDKRYFVCELGNYFGFENYSGCKKVAFKLLDELGWTRLGDVSIDSLPVLDVEALNAWLEKEAHVISLY